ncbi:hypothetical protein ACFLSH_03375 [Bacteroidota bacterium]
MNRKFLLILLLLNNFPNFCQYNGNDFSIGVYGFYTNSASIFLNPNASDIVLRNSSFDIEDIFNPGIDIRYRVSEPLILGLGVEYMKITETDPNLSVYLGGSLIPIDENGFKLIPIEFTAYYLLPFSTEGFKFLMGGGLGYYIGEFIRKVSVSEVTSIQEDIAIGIHVSVSMDYIPINNVVVRFQMKFRDPQFTVTNYYEILPEESFDTKVNVDGITFMLGAAVQF